MFIFHNMKVSNFHQDHVDHIYIEVFEIVNMKRIKNIMLNDFVFEFKSDFFLQKQNPMLD